MTQRINFPRRPTRLFDRFSESTKIGKAFAACLLLPAAFAIPAAHAAPQAVVKPVMTKDLADFPGKEALMLEVTYPPGSQDEMHRHDAHAFVYVMEGSIVMQLKGGAPVTLHAGQTFYEGPDDVHIVGRNASDTQPARFTVLLLKNKGAPALTPVH